MARISIFIAILIAVYSKSCVQAQAPSTCADKLLLSLKQLFTPQTEAFSQLCSSTTPYFGSCRDDFSSRCALVTECSSSDANKQYYLGWVDAFSFSGQQHTCNVGIKTIIGTLKNGSYSCFVDMAIKLMPQILELEELMWSARTFKCSDMASRMYNMMNVLDECSEKGLKNLVTSYYHDVVAASPCKDTIEIDINLASNVKTNTALLGLTFLLTLIVYNQA